MIRIYCDAADAVLKETQTLTAGMINYPEVLLTFSDAWDGYGKAVIVKAGEVEESALIVNNKFVVPSECLAESGVNLIVGVSGSDGVHTIPTIWCSCGEIMDGTDVNDSTAVGTATPSLVEQMLGYAEDVVEEAQYLKDYIIKTVEADATGANAYGTANVTVSDSGEGENRTLTFTFTNLKGNGITSLLFTASGENKGRVQVKLDDGTTTNYDGIKEALAAIDSLISDVETAEAARDDAESGRVTAEAGRESAEQDRVSSELSRETAETARQNAEGLRDSNEGVRVQNEAEREENENTRKSNEAARVSAEADRAAEFASWEVDGQYNGLKAEGYAIGKQNGADVSSGSPYYHNNAKYYSDRCITAETTAQNAANSANSSAANAGVNASMAQGYATNASISSSQASGYADAAALSATNASASATNAAQSAADSAANAALAAAHVYDISVDDTTLVVTSAQHGFTITVSGTTVVFESDT